MPKGATVFRRAARFVVRPATWLLARWAHTAEQISAMDQSFSQRAKQKTSEWANGHPILFGLAVAPPTGAVAAMGAVLGDGCSLWLQILFGAIGALAGFLLGVALVALVFWLMSPWKQRNELREAVLDERARVEQAQQQ